MRFKFYVSSVICMFEDLQAQYSKAVGNFEVVYFLLKSKAARMFDCEGGHKHCFVYT